MGTCTIQLHFHGEQNELIDNQKRPPQAVYNDTNAINSNISSNSLLIKSKDPKLKYLESNIKNKLLELGQFIQINHFNKSIGDDILLLIQTKKFEYKKYVTPPPTPTAELNPFQFKVNNDIYKGSWNNDLELEGYGIYYNNSKEIIIEGIWQNGENIFGRIFFPNKEIYQGEIKNSLPNGKGEFFNSEGDKYIGNFINGEISGKCKIFYEDNATFEGNIEKGIFQGEGKMIWGNNIEYTGNFENSMLSGKGTIAMIVNMKKEKYEGDFSENEFNGKGTYFFNNGDVYKGEFEKGFRKGNGVYIRNCEDKIIFEGKWIDDLPNGEGILSYGEYKLKGFWRNGDSMSSNNDKAEKENDVFNDINKNIKPPNISIFPRSLSHLNQINMNYSQFSREDLI